MRSRAWLWMALAALTVTSYSCRGGTSIKKTLPASAKPVVKDATKEELLASYNRIATGIDTLNATVELKPTAGSKYSGVIEEYHEVKAFLLAARPAQIRMIGQAPIVGTTVFDMASDGQAFRVSIPSKNKFLEGPVALERASDKPIENLRPQHLLDALLWPEVRREETVLFQEFNDENARFYVLTVLRGGYRMEVLRTIWFDRSDLHVARIENYGPGGVLLSDVRFSDWQSLPPESIHPAPGASEPITTFPHAVVIDRPHDDYRLDLEVTKIALNEDIPADRFKLDQPSGSELVRIGEAPEGKPQ